MDTLIRGKPIHSHLAERLVNHGNRMKIRGAHNEREDRVAAKVCAAANGTKMTGKPHGMSTIRKKRAILQRTRSHQFIGGTH